MKIKHEGQSGYIEGVGLMENGKTYDLDERRHKAYLAATSGKDKKEAAVAKKAKEKAEAKPESFREKIVMKKTGGEK